MTAHQDQNRSSPSPDKADGAPEGSEQRSRLDLPPPGSDAARNEDRKTPPDRNRGRTVDAP